MINVIAEKEVLPDDICINKSVSETTISPQSTLNVLNNGDVEDKLFLDYHKNEISQNERIFKLVKNIIYIGVGIIFVGIILSFFGLTTISIVSTVAGVIVEHIFCKILTLLSETNKNKLEYYKQLSFDRECDKYLKIIRNINGDENQKMKILNDLIENYCQRRK